MTQLNNELIRKETIQLANDGPTVHTTKYETKVPTLHKSYLLFFSLIISALTIAVPFSLMLLTVFSLKIYTLG